MFDNRGQSALEYLMTYGWALIVIAIVIGVLIFVTGGATGGATCQSQSQGIQLTEWAVKSGTDTVGLTLRNATGGNIVVKGATTDGTVFVGDVNNVTQNVSKNATFNITRLNGPANSGSFTNGTVNIAYTTAGGLDANALIACSGTA